jgi:hypothetical protein
MSSRVELSARSGETTVRVEHSARGRWKVLAPDRARPITCETLQDAERAAYLCLARTHARELIVCDAYHRVLHHELIAVRRAPPFRSSSPAAGSKLKPGGE